MQYSSHYTTKMVIKFMSLILDTALLCKLYLLILGVQLALSISIRNIKWPFLFSPYKFIRKNKTHQQQNLKEERYKSTFKGLFNNSLTPLKLNQFSVVELFSVIVNFHDLIFVGYQKILKNYFISKSLSVLINLNELNN